MQKQWSSFRITFLLYSIVLMLPFSFYFVYTSFETIKNDIKIVRQSSWLPGAMEYSLNHHEKDATKRPIDKVLQNIADWALQNSSSKLYIGAKSLPEELSGVTACWKNSQKGVLAQKDKCYTLAENMAVNIEKMVYLKQQKIINIFYISLLAAMILTLLMIYLTRVYIHTQIKKHAIYDPEIHLFNQKYFLAQLHTAIERAKREKSPLSICFLSIDNMINGQYDKKQQKHLIQQVAHILAIVTRESDTVCRYNDDHFAVLMSLTDKEDALNLEKRIRKALEAHSFHLTPAPQFNFKTTEFNPDETKEAFLIRSKNR